MFGTNLFQIADCVFVPTFCHFVDHLWLLLQISYFTKLVKNRLFVLEFCAVRQDTFYPQRRKIGTSQQIFDKSYFFNQHSQPLCDVMQTENKNLEFLQGVNFEFIDSLKNNGTKNLLIFDDSCEEICNSKAFVDIGTAGRHRGFSTIYIKRNLFHQNKLGRDVELQNTHIVLFKSPRDVMQVPTLGAQLGLRSELVDWYRDATSVPLGHLLIDLSPRTDDRLLYCTNSGSV